MFVRATNRWLSEVSSRQRNYGVAVTDVDNDGQFEMIVAGYSVRGRVVYFIGELYDRTYRLGSVTIKTKCVKLNY